MNLLFLGAGSGTAKHRADALRRLGYTVHQIDPDSLVPQGRLPITCLGHVPQPALKEILSRSHVMVLPSIEEGLALVQVQAMACGCPVIGTTNSGAEDLLSDGVEGFVTPIRDSEAIAERLQQLADDANLRLRMSQACLARVQSLGGWDQYGYEMVALFSELCGAKPSAMTLRPSGV